MEISLEQFVENLETSGLLSAAEVREFQDGLPPEKRPRDARALARELVRAKKLTKFQAATVYQGRTKGLVLGEYTVLEAIGAGGMGQVYKARHRTMERIVALKTLRRKAMDSPDAVKRFHREVRTAATLMHPNVVTAHDAGEHRGLHYLVMEYVDGKDLAAIVAEHGPLPVADAVDCILHAARGLQYAHAKGVIHRDIKPGNLLLDPEGTVKILDMGLARLGVEGLLDGAAPSIEQLTQSGQMMGTVDYMSPEQAEDTRTADHRADVYSLGCTLYRLLTGGPPYTGDTLMKRLLAHREAAIPSLVDARPDVPQPLDAVYRKMMAKRPEDRQQSMDEVIAELQSCSAPKEPAAAAVADEASSDGALSAFLKNLSRGNTAAEEERAFAKDELPPLSEDTFSQQADPKSETNVHSTPQPAATRRKRKVWLLAVVGGLLALLVLLGILLSIRTPHGTLVVETDDPNVKIAVKQSGKLVEIVDADSGWTIRVNEGKYDVELVGGSDKVELDRDTITVTRGDKVRLKVTLKRGPKPASPTATASKSAPPPTAVAPFGAVQAKRHQQAWADYLGVPVEKTNSIGMKLVLIPPGEFDMGSTQEEISQLLEEAKEVRSYVALLPAESPRHRVKITRPFCLGMHEVTQDEYQRVMGTNASGSTAGGGGALGQRVVWEDAVEFCCRLSELPEEKAAACVYRLPSEAQWEYGCRAGTTSRYYFGDDAKDLGDYVWWRGNTGGASLRPVGLKKPNAWGLYDMLGNVMEWCSDWYEEEYYKQSPSNDPTGPLSGEDRVVRGSSYGADTPAFFGCARRNYHEPDGSDCVGFRVVCEIPGTPPPAAVAPFVAVQAKRHQQAWADHLGVPVEKTNSVGMKLTLIPPGEFDMGSTEEEISQLLEEAKEEKLGQGYVDKLPAESPRHRVRITRPFYLGMHEVTQDEYQQVMGTNPSASTAGGGRVPVEAVRWEDAVEFCRKLSELAEEKAAARVYRLPSEAQWEYGCRAGTTTRYYFGNDAKDFEDYVWWVGNADGAARPVGLKKPNAWRLYDMLGNVREWCSDWYDKDYYKQSPSNNPTGPLSAEDRVMRGAAFTHVAPDGRCANRHASTPDRVCSCTGFRVLCEIPVTPPPAAVAPFVAAQAKRHQHAWADHLGVPVEKTSSIGMKLTLIPPGEFDMGSTEEEIERLTEEWATSFAAEGPQHRVKIRNAFYLGKYEVTVEEFRKFVEAAKYQTEAETDGVGGHAVMDGNSGPEYTWRKPTSTPAQECPVVQLSWNDADAFCNWLSTEEGKTCRLPTEAEWEYACRAGTTTPFSSGDEVDSLRGVANVADESLKLKWPSHERAEMTVSWDDGYAAVAPVGRLLANPLGLHDMHGNVWEWCGDWYDADVYKRRKQGDFSPTRSGTDRVVRGGSWFDPRPDLYAVRSANRQHFAADFRSNAVGFRVVCEILATPVRGDKPVPGVGDVKKQPLSAAAGSSRITGWGPWKDLFDGKTLDGWDVLTTGFTHASGTQLGYAEVRNGQLSLVGDPLGAAVLWHGDFPRQAYEIEMIVARLQGDNDFATLAFPVGTEYGRLVIGAKPYKGNPKVSGNSGSPPNFIAVDFLDGLAWSSEKNATCRRFDFQNGRWYRVRLRVTERKIDAWIDDAHVIDLDLSGHSFNFSFFNSDRRGFLAMCTKDVVGAIRTLRMRRLPAQPEPSDGSRPPKSTTAPSPTTPGVVTLPNGWRIGEPVKLGPTVNSSDLGARRARGNLSRPANHAGHADATLERLALAAGRAGGGCSPAFRAPSRYRW